TGRRAGRGIGARVGRPRRGRTELGQRPLRVAVGDPADRRLCTCITPGLQVRQIATLIAAVSGVIDVSEESEPRAALERGGRAEEMSSIGRSDRFTARGKLCLLLALVC